MEKKILEINVEEKDGEYVIRLKGEKAAALAECLSGMAACCVPGGGDKKAAASCC
jgi:hypothetical protein